MTLYTCKIINIQCELCVKLVSVAVLDVQQWPAHFQKFGRHTVTSVTKTG